ncbi:hypothetical protein [Psychromonas arctica]|uniref:hypothetical protein n=1 Tax=Psychromonas arctica TaxID=168275 RepID=UPI0003FE2A7A|nr:hypothetical protein [Psychromonas arctica]
MNQIFNIFITKLNNIINPKFQNVFIRSVFGIGVLLVAPKILNILAKFELITNDFIIKLEFLESSDTTLSFIGVVFILVSSWLFYNERRMNHEYKILSQSQDEDLIINYYVCENYERLVEINNGDLSGFPVQNAMILKNSIMSSLNEIIANHPDSYRNSNLYGDYYNSVEEYLEKYPEASIPNRSDGNFSYFQVTRVPNKHELTNLKDKDGLLKLMLEKNVEFPISIAGGYEDACAGIDLQEEFILRKLWCSFICITNNSDKSLQLNSMTGNHLKSDSFKCFSTNSSKQEDIKIPNVMLKSGQSVIVPICILIPPLYSFKRDEISSTRSEGLSDRIQITNHESIHLKSNEDCIVYGDRFSIRSIKYKKNKSLIETTIRDFDFTNMFTYDLHWQCGSCPHLFFVGENISYKKELLADCQNSIGTDSFSIPPKVSSVVIAEIEDEITHISSIKMNDVIVAKDLVLKNGEHFSFEAKAGAEVIITGYYVPDSEVIYNIPQGIKRNELVSNSLQSYQQ